MDERFIRTEKLIGSDGLARLRQARVTVVGLGAVGGYAVEALARSGVGQLRLVDFDVVHPSNINRQLLALDSTVGRAKVQVAGERVAQINPACRLELLEAFVHVETLDQVLADRPDVVVDAIDSVNPKLELLSAAVERGLAVFTSMGAALRRDPAAVRTGLLEEVTHCPLARILRKKLRRRGIRPAIPCVYSVEPMAGLSRTAIGEPDQAAPGGLRQRGRPRRVLGSLSTLTGIFGLTLANLVIDYLLESVGPNTQR